MCIILIALSCYLAFRLPESPLYLIKVGKYAEAKLALDSVAEINGVKPVNWKYHRFTEELQSQLDHKSLDSEVQTKAAPEKIYDFNNLTDDRVHFANLVIMNVAWSSTSFGFYLISYYMKYIPGDIYTNVVLSALADCLSSFFSGYLITKVGTQKTLVVSFFISGIFSLLLVFTQ